MTHYGAWSPYGRSNSIILAVVLLIVTGVLMYLGVVAFFVIAYSARRSGFWVAFGSALVGTIAAEPPGLSSLTGRTTYYRMDTWR